MEIRKILRTVSFKCKRICLRWLFATVIVVLSVFITFNYWASIEKTFISREVVNTKKKSVDDISANAVDIGSLNLILDSLNRSELKIPSVQKTVNTRDLSTSTINDTRQQFNSTYEIPEIYLHSSRFDILIKMVYAYFYSVIKLVPEPIKLAYTEHLRVWNGFHEYCSNTNKRWFDATIPCRGKKNATDFLSSFQNTIENIEKHGFMSNTSQIPVDNTGFVLNGAHRLSASVILGKNATFQHLNYTRHFGWNYKFFKQRGLSNKLANLMILEWMKIQVLLPSLKRKVSIISIISNDTKKDKMMREIVKENCAADKGILYEHEINITKLGMRQLVTHMYGKQYWLGAKIADMISKFTSEKMKISFLFFYGKNMDELKRCKYEVRKLYNDRSFKSSAHIPDTPEESLILAEMILNPNSVHFLNFAKNGHKCQSIAKELALRSSLEAVTTLPEMYVGRDDVMVDSGSVLNLFNLREATDVDILFLNAIDEAILGKRNSSDVYMEAHAFKSNAISLQRPWGEDHLNERVKTKWNLFYDPDNYGFCYGLKFVSLQELVEYKLKRNEPNKDERDVTLISNLLKLTND